MGLPFYGWAPLALWLAFWTSLAASGGTSTKTRLIAVLVLLAGGAGLWWKRRPTVQGLLLWPALSVWYASTRLDWPDSSSLPAVWQSGIGYLLGQACLCALPLLRGSLGPSRRVIVRLRCHPDPPGGRLACARRAVAWAALILTAALGVSIAAAIGWFKPEIRKRVDPVLRGCATATAIGGRAVQGPRDWYEAFENVSAGARGTITCGSGSIVTVEATQRPEFWLDAFFTAVLAIGSLIALIRFGPQAPGWRALLFPGVSFWIATRDARLARGSVAPGFLALRPLASGSDY